MIFSRGLAATYMNANVATLTLASTFLLTALLACSNAANKETNSNAPTNTFNAETIHKPEAAAKPAKLQSYSIKGIKFAYYRIAAGLKQDDLIATAQKLHDAEPDTQIIMVDDDSRLADYINYVKAISGEGELDKPLPVDWADKHVIANIQKYTSGKFVLCEGTGSIEIADLK